MSGRLITQISCKLPERRRLFLRTCITRQSESNEQSLKLLNFPYCGKSIGTVNSQQSTVNNHLTVQPELI
ncbi:hypothetical protein IQ269_03865 [Tychonema sp. LEGE 07199]|uniref:hypothetical protein n=1 Tax=unclassified Tychonema TaxID=2642144 RepID=UPI001882CB58|nr:MULTISPECIES: hypothetical protein [unclassified Tychonema]MBE9119962.1 hypothetical protein [Tychonema sp. LEGE 07199]MBE9134490.1 hypothetical protein [Tychonema sp. LEGE 07196]